MTEHEEGLKTPSLLTTIDNGSNPPSEKCDPSVTAVSTAITMLLQRDPSKKWTPKEIATEIHASANAVTKAIGRSLASKSRTKPIPVVKVAYGYYQYEAPDEVPVNKMIEHYGKLGVENLVYCSETRVGRLGGTLPNNDWSNLDVTQAISKPGYPVYFITGQEIRWEIWPCGVERVSFISNKRPFSIDLLIYLHDQMAGEGLVGSNWQRQSIEYNIDSLNVTLKPEYVDVQTTRALLLKAYNHGQQMRNELADRRMASLQNTVEDMLYHYEYAAGREAMKELESLKKKVDLIAGETRLAVHVARAARQRFDSHIAGEKAEKNQMNSLKIQNSDHTDNDNN